MSKKPFKSQASSSRAISNPFASVATSSNLSFGTGFGGPPASPLSYIYEPPDLKGISDSAVVVAFKNLQKKDSTTKAKALEDLQEFLSNIDKDSLGVEDEILEAWIRLYPRTSIDNARRVRQLAHIVHGSIASLAGKRIAKHMPSVVGAWLSGLHDSDKLVARSAQDAFDRIFPGKEKQTVVWKAYKAPILQYCSDAILKETVQSLSDERTASPDDAEAKYARVVGNAVLTIVSALGLATEDELETQKALYSNFLREDSLWKLSTFPDPFVRRSLYRLLVVALRKPSVLDFQSISLHVLQEGLHSDQTGSAYEFVKTLVKLTETEPLVWTDFYSGSGKKAATKRFCSFLRKGSQRGPLDFWTQLSQLIRVIPVAVLQPLTEEGQAAAQGKSEDPSVILKALHDGIIRKDEYRSSRDEAWKVYLQLAERLQSSISKLEWVRIREDCLAPIIEQYILQSASRAEWNVGQEQEIPVAAILLSLQGSSEETEDLLTRLSDSSIQDLQISLPEQSKDFTKSQDAVIARLQRFYRIKQALSKAEEAQCLRKVISTTTAREIEASISIVKARNGKPYSAAAALEIGARELPEAIINDENLQSLVLLFVKQDLPSLMTSPSAPYLLRLLDTLNTASQVQSVYAECLKTLIEAPKSPGRLKALMMLLSSPWPQYASASEALRRVVLDSFSHALNNDEDSWLLVNLSLQNSTAPSSLINDLLSIMTGNLSRNLEATRILSSVETAIRHQKKPAREYLASSKGTELMSKLLFLSQDVENMTVSTQATRLKDQAESLLSNEQYSEIGMASMVDIVRRGIIDLEATSLSVDTLAGQARKLLGQENALNTELPESLLPDAWLWSRALEPFVSIIPEDSLALTNSLGGAIYLIQQDAVPSKHLDSPVPIDRYGMSACLRIAWYVMKLLEMATDIRLFELLPFEAKVCTCKYIAVFSQILSDHLNVPTLPALWKFPSGTEEARDIVSAIVDLQSQIGHFFTVCSLNHPECLELVVDRLLEDASGSSISAYYSARAYAMVDSELREHADIRWSDEDEKHVGNIRKSRHVIAETAFLTGVSESKGVIRLCNELISDITECNFGINVEQGLSKMILLNTLFRALNQKTSELPHQRLVFFIKHVLESVLPPGSPQKLISEALKLLIIVLPPVKDLYGEFWEQSCDLLINCLRLHESMLPLLYAALKLCGILRSLASESCNDDLSESWNDKEGTISAGLIQLVHEHSKFDDSSHQPRMIVNGLLFRQLQGITNKEIEDSVALYPVLASESVALQRAAYDMLHQKIPSEQENVSLDAALTKDFVAKLPEELLSLILEVPGVHDYFNLRAESDVPSPLLRYLLSWKLIFDHWKNASYQVQSDYVDSIKDGTYLKDLLSFAFDFLIHSRGVKHMVNPSKYDIKIYVPSTAENPENDVQWLLTHLYYLALEHLPLLCKSWWRSECPRALEKQVEEWTERYISPLIIQDELEIVSTWEPNPDETTSLEVKVSQRGHEVTASYPIDEQMMAIRISLPPGYPLHPAIVSTQHRVGVDEKKWSAWLNTSTIAINFSSSSQGLGCVVDGLVAWRKNVSGTLKGQSECAICYSVVSADRQLPSKRCGTCKNSFHGSCLYRWFKSSSSSSCPLCRNAFNYA